MGLFRHVQTGERVHIPDGSTHPGTRGEHTRLTESDAWERIGDDYRPASADPVPTPEPAAEPATKTTRKG